jgi:pimeloyl-ACP methyl ester carboxylesterase
MTIVAPAPLQFIDPGTGRTIALRHRAARDGQPTIVFLPGYASDMDGQKAIAIDSACALRGRGSLRFDYSGTGSSPADFADGTLDRWCEDALGAIDHAVPDGRLILAGSSMGGWLALHVALRRPARIAAILGIAAAPDFTDWGYSADDKAIIDRDGKLERENPYGPEPSLITRGFWQSGARHRLLDTPIDLDLPIRLVHGDSDGDVPLEVPIRLMSALRSADVQLRLIKGGAHRLSEPHEIEVILAELDTLVKLIEQ